MQPGSDSSRDPRTFPSVGPRTGEERRRFAGATPAKEPVITTERADAARGAALLPSLSAGPELSPEAARVIGEVPGYLGVPFVSPIFQALANYPGYLVPAWDRFKPVIGSPEFRRAAAGLGVPGGLLPGPDPALLTADADLDRVRRYTVTFHRLLPELLLLASCWYRGVTVGAPASLALDGRTPVEGPGPRGVPPEAVTIAPDPSEPEEDLARVYQEIRALHDHPRVLSYYRALGTWPGLMLGVWERLGPLARGDAYTAARDQVLARAAATAATLPVPLVEPEHAGEVAAVLALSRPRLIPALLLDTAVVLALLGEDTQVGEDASVVTA
ncbi:halocarboxylic acid dehydrogenase DehI family protein [Nonomuraea sp. 3-1Str]|uniref:halocarboxylic acid dehydrogenase DehI family protein n=1 Tax=Nonomuraea sp. 3-1Str TaxID=2929801 RepID=UPI002863E216|nr:halocarboxylic acid dehydrogenase DehI family protein [Nonomuraea sp. 3-1Str]MDR8410304.1 halocarboxylic acid dehydrogenase DehI family protein [Nonomuraea sp. 3-1Str]